MADDSRRREIRAAPPGRSVNLSVKTVNPPSLEAAHSGRTSAVPRNHPARQFLPLLAVLSLCTLLPLAAADVTAGDPAMQNEPAEVAALRLKAVRGNAIAQYNLGLAYAEGRQVASDPAEAWVWLTLAAQHGSRDRALDALVAKMTPEQIAEIASSDRLTLRRKK